MEYVATTNKQLEYSGIPTATVVGTAAIAPKFKAGGYNVLYGSMSVTITAMADGTFVNPGPVTLSISPTSKNIYGGVEGSAILRENDEGSISVVLTDPGKPPFVPPTTKTVTIGVKISSAGQTEVKSE